MLASSAFTWPGAVSTQPAFGPMTLVKVGAAYDSVLVDVMQVSVVSVTNFVGRSVTVVVSRTISYMVVVGAVPAKSVVLVWTAGAVTIVVMVRVGILFPMHEHAVTRASLGRDSRAETARLGLQIGSIKAATGASWTYVVRVVLSVRSSVSTLVMV